MLAYAGEGGHGKSHIELKPPGATEVGAAVGAAATLQTAVHPLRKFHCCAAAAQTQLAPTPLSLT